ncbi:unnamed protein product [Schistosoma rodhaini]|nr:unnamed protein product [Schistosoma rodhaini]
MISSGFFSISHKMTNGTLEKSLKQPIINIENHENKTDIEINDEIEHWTKILNHNVNKMKRSENSTHVTGKNSCIETDFKREMKRYYIGLKQNLDKIDRIQEETAIKMNRLYKESRKLARRGRNEKKQSLKFYRKHSSKSKNKLKSTRETEEEENEEQPQPQQERDLEQRQKDKVLHDQNNETISSEMKLTNQLPVLSPFLPVIRSNEIVSLTSNRNTTESIIKDIEFKQGQTNTELIKPNISSWLETINEGEDNANDQEAPKPSKLDTPCSIQHLLQSKYSICEKNQTRQSIAYSIIRHKEKQLCNLKAALSEAPIAYLWKDNVNKSTTKLKTKLICSKYKDINLQAKRCLPGSIGGLSNYFLEVIALPKPALIRFPPPTSMHQYTRRKILAAEKQQMQQNLNKLSHLTEEMRRALEGQKLMAALKFLLASTSNEKK